MHLRFATLEDVGDILVELRKFDEFCGFKKSLYDEKITHSVVESFVTNNQFWVMYDGDKLAGFICGLLSPHVMNPEVKVFYEVLWWVTEGYRRKSGVGTLLFNEFQEFGEANADMIVVTSEDVSPIPDTFFLHKGFKLKERAFLKEMN